LFLAGLLVSLRNWRRPAFFFALSWLVVGLIPSMITPQAPSTIRMIGALPVVYLFPVLVFSQLARRFPRIERAGKWIVGAWLAITVVLTVRDGFVRWPAAGETRDKYQTVLLEMTRHMESAPTGSVVADGWYDPIDDDSLRRNLGYDPGARWVQAGGAIVYPAGGGGRLYVPEYAPPVGALWAAGDLPLEPSFRSDNSPSFAVYPLPGSPAVPVTGPQPTFGEAITLLGFQLLDPAGPESTQLITYWRVEAPLPWDLSIFAHLLAPDRSIVAQHDGMDAAAITLRPGDEFIQWHSLPMPSSVPAGPHTLQVGLYRRGDGTRLTHPGDPADRIVLIE
jgi:hypothetical protein